MTYLVREEVGEKPDSPGAWVRREFSFQVSQSMAEAEPETLRSLFDKVWRRYLPAEARIDYWTIVRSGPHFFTDGRMHFWLVYAWVKDDA